MAGCRAEQKRRWFASLLSSDLMSLYEEVQNDSDALYLSPKGGASAHEDGILLPGGADPRTATPSADLSAAAADIGASVDELVATHRRQLNS